MKCPNCGGKNVEAIRCAVAAFIGNIYMNECKDCLCQDRTPYESKREAEAAWKEEDNQTNVEYSKKAKIHLRR